MYALLAVGLDLIFGILGIVNFAYGDFLMIAMFAVYFALVGLHTNLVVAGLLAIVPTCLFGILLWKGIIGIGKDQERQMLATLGLSTILINVGNLVLTPDPHTVSSTLTSSTLSFGGIHVVGEVLLGGLIMGALVVAIMLIVRRTIYGIRLRALAANEVAARLYGIDDRSILLLTILLSSLCLAAVAAVLLPNYSVSPTVGLDFTLIAYMAVILGGMGTIVGPALAGMLIGVVQTVGGLWLQGSLPQTLVALCFLLVVSFHPTGLFGRRTFGR